MDILQEGGLESREEVMRAWTKAEALNIEQHQNFQVMIIDIVSDEKGNSSDFQCGIVAVKEVKKI